MAKLIGIGSAPRRALGQLEERKQAIALLVAGVILGAAVHQLVKGKNK